MVDEIRRTSARAFLSAIAATLLVCGGAALIAGVPHWVTRLALGQVAGSRIVLERWRSGGERR
jgi:hypothetical protein